MAVCRLKLSMIFTIFTVFLFFHELYASPFSSVHGIKVRRKREQCADGSYQHEGNTCCECAAGQRLKQHCNKTHLVTCENCEAGTFNSLPNHQDVCLPCTSCNQPNANLEEEDACTPGRDAKCRCKKGHYCNSETHVCKICQPCDACDSVGIKELCTSISNTICNEETSNAGVIAAIVVSVVLLVIGICAFVAYKYLNRRTQGPASTTDRPSGEPVSSTEQIPLVDIQPRLPDIAKTLGWKDMKDLAIRSGISDTTIDAVKLNYPNDSEECCLDLLRRWVESKGKHASQDLVLSLRKSGKIDKADRILEILNNSI